MLFTIGLWNMTATLHSDSDVDPHELLTSQQEQRLFKLLRQLHTQNHLFVKILCAHTLYRRVEGSMRWSGFPLTFIAPFPWVQWATAVAVFYTQSTTWISILYLMFHLPYAQTLEHWACSSSLPFKFCEKEGTRGGETSHDKLLIPRDKMLISAHVYMQLTRRLRGWHVMSVYY